ncbi:MAG TPA: hypothetical protein VFT58_03165, partial [Nitrososphaera sp.]|nr:hypothetical protein [Nitrososphaera sp.]
MAAMPHVCRQDPFIFCQVCLARDVIIIPQVTDAPYIYMRVRYWRLGITDVLDSAYPAEKANHWD